MDSVQSGHVCSCDLRSTFTLNYGVEYQHIHERDIHIDMHGEMGVCKGFQPARDKTGMDRQVMDRQVWIDRSWIDHGMIRMYNTVFGLWSSDRERAFVVVCCTPYLLYLSYSLYLLYLGSAV
jgi:hypothetical protein